MKDESKQSRQQARSQGGSCLSRLAFFILHPSSFILLSESLILVLLAGVCGAAAPAARVVLTPSQARLLEMKVELACLSDKETWPCELHARWMGAALEVQGRAPSSGSKERALELAQQLSPVPVLDGIHVVPGQAALRVPAGGSLNDLATRLSQHRAGAEVHGLVIWPEPDGRLVVSGSVSSVEEKLAVSSLLRELGAGGRVWNRLVVRPVVHDGQLVTLVTADGRCTVPGRPALEVDGGSGNPGFLPVPSRLPVETASVERAPAPARRRLRKPTTVFASARLETAGGEELSSAHAGGDAQGTASPSLVPLPLTLAEPATGPPAPSTQTGQNEQRPSHLPSPEPALETSEEAEQTAPAPYQGSPQAQQLKQKIDQVCGRFAQYIEIVDNPEGNLVVRLQVPSDALEQMLLGRLLTLPEIASHQIRLEAIVKP